MTVDKQTRMVGWIHIALGGLGLLARTAKPLLCHKHAPFGRYCTC
jgi:hypothetical protein